MEMEEKKDKNTENIINFVITCVCCLTNSRYTRNIYKVYLWHGIPEVYGDMLEKCFGIKFRLKTENVDLQICDSCIKKLRCSLRFKQSVLKTHKEIYQYFSEDEDNSDLDEIGSEYLENIIKKESDNDIESICDGNKENNEDIKEDDDFSPEIITGDLEDCGILNNEGEENFQNDETDFKIEEQTTSLQYDGEDVNIEYLEDENFLEEENVIPSKKRKQAKTSSKPAKPPGQCGSSKRRDYLEEQLQDCMQAIKDGLMSQNQAAALYNVPRQTVQVRLKKELGDQYEEVVHRWRQHLVRNRPKPVSIRQRKQKQKPREVNVDICLKKIKSGSMSVMAATKKYNVSSAAIKRALKEEYGDRYLEVVLTLRRQYFKVRRERGEVYNRESHLGKLNRSKPDKETLVRAVYAVKEKKMTKASAANYFGVTSKLLDRLIVNNVDVENTGLRDLLKPPRMPKNYTKETLEECLESVRTGRLKQKVASRLYKIPQQTIYMRLREEFDQKSKSFEHKERTKVVDEIIKNTPVPEAIPDADVQTVIEEQNTKTVSEEIIKSVKSVISNTNVTPFRLNKGYYACVCCDMDTNNIDNLREHYHEAHAAAHVDTFVDAFFQNTPQTDVIRLDMVNLTCNICSESIKRWSFLAKHLESHELSLDRGCWYFIIPYIVFVDYKCCALCQIKFENVIQLDQHLSKHYKNYDCDECGESFLTEKWLLHHKHLKELAGGECACEMCSEWRVGVPQVSEVVEEKRLVNCHHCADGFNDYYSRYIHMLQHHKHKLKQYICVHCGKHFRWRPFYIAHLKEHDEEEQE